MKTTDSGKTEKVCTSRTYNSNTFTNQGLPDKCTLVAKERKKNIHYSSSISSSSKSNKDMGSQKGENYNRDLVSESRACQLLEKIDRGMRIRCIDSSCNSWISGETPCKCQNYWLVNFAHLKKCGLLLTYHILQQVHTHWGFELMTQRYVKSAQAL